MKSHRKSFGYFHITISAEGEHALIKSNSERAFVVAQLQDLLSPRLLLGDIPAHKQLASCVDLLAFSIRRQSIQLLIFSIDASLSEYFAGCIAARFQQYKSEVQPEHRRRHASLQVRVTTERLAGPHHALRQSAVLHLLHEDWEYDRYSSVGFYLHDRRGDWMRTWRLAQLYDNNPRHYRKFLRRPLHEEGRLIQLPAS